MTRTLCLLWLLSSTVFGQENWKRPFPAHKIAGNLFYVGTEDLACFLITTPEGHILVNTGLADSTPLIRAGIEKLGYKVGDIKILLTMQAHFDHVAAMAEIQRLSGAKVYATEPDAPAMEDGGKSDPVFNAPSQLYAPIRVDRRLKDGDVVKLGGSVLRVHLTPGHTKGSAGYSMTVNEGAKKLNVLIVNLGTAVMPLVNNQNYPEIAKDFAKSFELQKKLAPDIWVAAHASQYSMQEKLKAGSFVDPAGYKVAIERYEKMFREKLAAESSKH
ncbi:MAG: subclass B3 metallo-beta-lactamase [Bryobacteraceae bacterium]|nr:subclass B3 metallo-beta-lactamase [Bryobacteraceae bacterium]